MLCVAFPCIAWCAPGVGVDFRDSATKDIANAARDHPALALESSLCSPCLKPAKLVRNQIQVYISYLDMNDYLCALLLDVVNKCLSILRWEGNEKLKISNGTGCAKVLIKTNSLTKRELLQAVIETAVVTTSSGIWQLLNAKCA